MTTKQKRWYFREWNAVKKVRPDFTDEDRYDLHEQAIGKRKSSKDLTNAEFSLVIAAFKAISDPANLDFQLRQLGMARKNRIMKIRQLLPATYLFEILKDGYGGRHLEDLSDKEVQHCLYTATKRAAVINADIKPDARLPEFAINRTLNFEEPDFAEASLGIPASKIPF